ncbi:MULTISPECIES: siderophore ferric iron reductase [unclassified Paludibacterium]|uniref:siderophore ferric iron reductase n=1 Tax=unclassified Paludibacterium TaxID=2618429 RepID=UPI001C04CF9D|nr:siderophore ferric iron reductase [Paludibacterium sp. B53371]BEV71816.1 alcaligin biosynthesis protein AlcD [Paludibacterium sp. THUN1379]
MSRLQHLLHEVATAQPGLAGEVGSADDSLIVPGGPAAPLDALLAYWQRAQPEAGPLYWASRCWTMLVWQPVYLMIWAWYRSRAVPRLAGMAQRHHQGVVAGFALPPHEPLPCDAGADMAQAGQEVAQLSRLLLADLGSRIRLHPKMAGRLQADCVLSVLIDVARASPDWDFAVLRTGGRAWLAAMGLADQSDLQSFPLPDGGQGVGLLRRVCCQHFRCAQGEYCASCPKLGPETRLARLQEAWLC